MGMSASQARLLSITARLTNNEFRSQTITNSKLRLATETQDASQAYMDALASQNFEFMYYDYNGNREDIALTHTFLSTYAPLKNQYSVVNSAGKILVSHTDAENFANTDNLWDFLKCYTNVQETEASGYDAKYAAYTAQFAKYTADYAHYRDVLLPEYDQKMLNYASLYADYEAQMEEYNTVTWPNYLTEKAQYDALYAQYLQDLADYVPYDMDAYYNSGAYQNYLAQKAIYDVDKAAYDAEYEIYRQELANLPENDMYRLFTEAVGDIYNPKSCYQHAVEYGDDGCYEHVLTYLLGYSSAGTIFNSKAYVTDEVFTCSIGESYTLDYIDITGSDLYIEGYSDIMEPIMERMKDPTLLCDGDDNYTPPYRKNGVIYQDTVKENIIQAAYDAGKTPTLEEILRSDYINEINPETGKYDMKKTLKQKAVDLLYILKNKVGIHGHPGDLYEGGYLNFTYAQIHETIINFTDGDFKSIATVVPPVPPIEPKEPPLPPAATPPAEPTPLDVPEKPTFTATKPAEPTPPTPPVEPTPEYIITVEDQAKSQWYTNLWFKMNGSDTANLVRNKQIPIDEALGTTTTVFVVEGAEKDEHKQNWEELDGNLTANSEWLEFALEHGVVTMEQARYYNPSEDSGKVPEILSEGITWQSIIHKEAADIRVVDDEVTIAKAEAKYKHDMKEIQDKDKKYDQDLKKLDTEHSALLTEFDSIKEAISKNEERSFKAFS